MSLLCVQTQNLSWQDRTLNIELMMSPVRSQLLYNKHKGLKTKFEQENTYLAREKDSYLKSFKTDVRLMERRKDVYSKRRNDIILKRTIVESRKRSSSISGPPGRTSAPPRLEREPLTASTSDSVFITELQSRETMSANNKLTVEPTKPHCRCSSEIDKIQEVNTNRLCPLIETPDLRTVSPCDSTHSLSQGKPFLQSQKAVRFLPGATCCTLKTPLSIELPVDDRIKRFLSKQIEFNTAGPRASTAQRRKLIESNRPARGCIGLGVNMSKLENAFDDFCKNESAEELQKLVRYATKVKATARNARNSAIMPRRLSILATV